ncbi:MAG: efflux RND transporter periplasmic adaptor subunit [Planctomycetaceae bacterium]
MPSETLVTDFEQFPGRLMPAEIVDVRSRVSGYLDRVLFKDGDVVERGQALFEIDPRAYQAEFDRAQAAAGQAEAHLQRLRRQEDRAEGLLSRKAISQEDYETAVFDRREAEAALQSARASLELAQLELDFTKITAKIGGRMSRRLADPGNLVVADETSLATVVALDPIYAYFDIDERTLLRLQRLVQERKLPYSWNSELPVQLALADEDDFSAGSYRGTLNFTDNQVDPASGSLRARALVQNPDGFLAPGLFVRIRIPVGPEHPALHIPEKALVSDQGQRFVYVVRDDDTVEYRRVKVGQSVGDQRVVSEGLRLGDRVVVDGFHRLRRAKPGAGDETGERQKVNPKPWPGGNAPVAAAASGPADAATQGDSKLTSGARAR